MVRVIRSKELLSSVRKDRRSYPFQKQSPTFRTARRNPLKKRDVIRAKKNSSAVRASAKKNYSAFCLATKLKGVFEFNEL